MYEHVQIQMDLWATPLMSCRQVHKRVRKTGDILALLECNTIVPDDLNRYDRKQLPRLSLHEMLGSPACVVSQASGVVASLQCQYYSTGFWASRFAGGLVVQLASAMATFSFRLNVDSMLAQEACAQWPWPTQPALGTRRYAPRGIECISMANHVILHMALSFWPIRCKTTISENI